MLRRHSIGVVVVSVVKLLGVSRSVLQGSLCNTIVQSSRSSVWNSLETGSTNYNCVNCVEGRLLHTSSVHCWWRPRKMGNGMFTEQGLKETNVERENRVELSDEEWKAKLTADQYQVCRQRGTEPAWTGELLDENRKGSFRCSCCDAELFSSGSKFDSGSGWPSFFEVLKDKDNREVPAVSLRKDESAGMIRMEVLCGKCDAHLGHVFDDGPHPTGIRYCINSVSLKFVADS